MKIEIKKTTILLIIFFAVFYNLGQLFLFTLAVFVHELSHMLVAKKYKLKISSLTITPLGMFCKIDNIDTLQLYKKIILHSIGIIINIIIFLIISLFNISNEYINYFKYSNFILFLFNILPIYPLDGAKIYINVFSYFKGYLSSVKAILKLGKYVSILIIIIGFIQMILFPFNILLYSMGIYLYKKNNDLLFSQLCLMFYRNLEQKYLIKNKLKVNHIFFNKDTTVQEVLNKLSSDTIVICYFYYNDTLIDFDEQYIVNCIQTLPATTKLFELDDIVINATINKLYQMTQ